jgi:uncharacterized protein YggE
MNSGRRFEGVGALIVAVALAAPALAAEPSRIVVAGVGEVRTMPNFATASFKVRGEGATADAATGALVKMLEGVRREIASVSGVKVALATSEMNTNAVRGPECKSGYDDGPQLSKGDCAIIGYVAKLEIEAEVSPPQKAGTVLGLAARAGAEDASVSSFGLRDTSSVEKQAFAAALTDARQKAQAIAEGAGGHIGALVSVIDKDTSGYDSKEVSNVPEPLPLPDVPVQPRPPVAVELSLKPVVTTARVVASYLTVP